MPEDMDPDFVPHLIKDARISLGAARLICRAALHHAAKDGIAISCVVVDRGGAIILSERMDRAETMTIDIAAMKAKTAVLFGAPSSAVEQFVAGPLPGLLSVPGLCAVGGGVPLIFDYAIVGAIGISGSTTVKDAEIAQVGADSLVVALTPVQNPT